MALDMQVLSDAIVRADAETGTKLTQQGLDDGMTAQEIMDQGLIGGMDIIADLWTQEKIFIPEVLIAAQVMQSCMDILRPLLEGTNEPPRGVAVIGTVQGDVHNIGQNIITMMLKGNGFETHNIGPNSSPDDFINKIKEVNADLVLLSALLTTTMPMQGETIKALDAAGLLDTVAVMVGGAPVTAEWAEKIGADGYAPDAAHAVKLAQLLVQDLREDIEAPAVPAAAKQPEALQLVEDAKKDSEVSAGRAHQPADVSTPAPAVARREPTSPRADVRPPWMKSGGG